MASVSAAPLAGAARNGILKKAAETAPPAARAQSLSQRPAHMNFLREFLWERSELKLAVPHVGLVGLCVAYAGLGAYAFASLEGSPPANASQPSDFDATLLRLKTRLATRLGELRASGEPMEAGKAVVDEYSRALYDLRRAERKRDSWSVGSAFFFAATTLTSIGYGRPAPWSESGRVLAVLYILVGLPLTLVTIADLAKFATQGLTWAYLQWLRLSGALREWWAARKSRRKPSGTSAAGLSTLAVESVEADADDDEVAELIWVHLENTQLVEVPFVVAYLLLTAYILLGGLLMRKVEGWSWVESLYFAQISVLTIGLGDLVPSSENLGWVLAYLALGLVVATTCIDIVGVQYLEKIHRLGRRLEEVDPMTWLEVVQQRRIKAMKQEAIRNLLSTMTAFTKFSTKKDSTAVREEEEVKSVPTEASPLVPREPSPVPGPPAPTNFKVVKTTSRSVKLRWELPEEGLDGSFWYSLSYKPRTPASKVRKAKASWRREEDVYVHVDYVRKAEHEVFNLKSLTLYEFLLCASDGTQRSAELHLEEYTEPSTVAVNLRLVSVAHDNALLIWDRPYRNRDKELYRVLWATVEDVGTEGSDDWEDTGTSRRCRLTRLRPLTQYAVCVAARHNADLGMTNISKTVHFTTPDQSDVEEFVQHKESVMEPQPDLLF